MKRRYVGAADFTEEAEGKIRTRPRLIVGISGASGVIYGARLLELLQPLPVETHLVISRTADVTLAVETDLKPAAIRPGRMSSIPTAIWPRRFRPARSKPSAW